jgi:hypothetical protein
MRKEIGPILTGCGIEVIFLILSTQIKEMPIGIAIAGYVVGGLLILYGVVCMIFPQSNIREIAMSIRIRSPLFRKGNNAKVNYVASWLEQILEDDKKTLGKRIHHFTEHWYFGNIHATEPSVEVSIKIINAAVFPIVIKGIEGSFAIQGTKCNWDATVSQSRIPHGESSSILISQRLLKETVDMMVKLHNQRDGFLIDLNSCRLVIQTDEPNVENKPVEIPLHIREQLRITA